MGRITLEQAALWCGGQIDPQYKDVAFFGANNDTRKLQPGQLMQNPFELMQHGEEETQFNIAALEYDVASDVLSMSCETPEGQVFNETVADYLSAVQQSRNPLCAKEAVACIRRAALAPVLPAGEHGVMLIDCGANVDCLPHYLPQFGIMGSAYMRCVRGLENPRVGLVNNGAEAEKGNEMTKAAYPLMEKAPFNFIGNVEGRGITADVADVVVADGFSGNLILKFMEGVAGTLMGIIKNEMYADLRGKIGGLIAKPAFRRVKKMMDYTEVGGAPLLGVKGVVVKAHGSCNAHAIACALKQAILMHESDVVGKIQQGLVCTAAETVTE